MLCSRIADVEAPFIFLPAIEKGSTTPTKNVKEGWIISCNDNQSQGTWLWLKDNSCQKELSGNASATFEKESTSPIIGNITKPRYTSTEAIAGLIRYYLILLKHWKKINFSYSGIRYLNVNLYCLQLIILISFFILTGSMLLQELNRNKERRFLVTGIFARDILGF